MKKLTYFLLILAISFSLFSCGGGNGNSHIKSPLDSIATAMTGVDNYVVVLKDVDYSKKNDCYVHKYNILETKKLENVTTGDSLRTDTIITRTTKWLPVSDALFKKHEKDVGMELLSKKDGKLSKIVSPLGYSQYVGNEKYGRWERNNQGHSVWHFFGQYMFMRTMFHMAFFPVRRSYYSTYGTYRKMGRSYYGNGTYGSGSRFNKKVGVSSWSKRPSSFRKSVNTKTTRRSSRYSKNSSKSRSGGFGK